jgi:hypothetical protein
MLRYLSLLSCIVLSVSTLAAQNPPGSRWYKGNLHTHSFWSDGDDFPEMIVGWYKSQGYDFLAISDHNVLHHKERWLAVGTNQTRVAALAKYIGKFGTNWVETRGPAAGTQVRLKKLEEYRGLFEEPGRFLLIQSEEISDDFEKLPIHLNASNIKHYIPPQGGKSVREVMQNNVNAVLEQARATGEPILPHLNHPNFGWAVTAEDLAAVEGERFFEVYNGHPSVHNEGDSLRASTDRIWDIALTLRLCSSKPEPLYGIATDDTHNYHRTGLGLSNGGRGWIMVRCGKLTPESLIEAMGRGDFYASSGVTLKDFRVHGRQLSVEVLPEAGVDYTIQFIGSRKGVDVKGEAVMDTQGKPMVTTRRYSQEIGRILQEHKGPSAEYQLTGDELYVRARVVSSKNKANPSSAGEKEMAWCQPLFNVRTE